MPGEVIIPRASPLYVPLARMAGERRAVFFAGLPGAGKSLLVQQLARLAHAAGRRVHLVQWDVARAAFETPELLARYPEVEGVTHAAIRKAVGLWARDAVLRWHEAHPDPAHLLIGETPLVGGRLVELAQVHDDAAEVLLASPATLFAVPVPSAGVRARIEAARERTSAAPAHGREAADAPPNVLRALWAEVAALGARLDGAATPAAADYDPAAYARVYAHALRHRHHEVLPVDEFLPAAGSVYDLGVAAGELAPTPEEVAVAVRRVEEGYGGERLARAVERWYEG
ncbi:MAG TPA: hypothetical protein VFW96_05740 [Thermomicrobiales bacterium]|nr:hypothetical protein [Thermomicrobiales bacterium]